MEIREIPVRHEFRLKPEDPLLALAVRLRPGAELKHFPDALRKGSFLSPLSLEPLLVPRNDFIGKNAVFHPQISLPLLRRKEYPRMRAIAPRVNLPASATMY